MDPFSDVTHNQSMASEPVLSFVTVCQQQTLVELIVLTHLHRLISVRFLHHLAVKLQGRPLDPFPLFTPFKSHNTENVNVIMFAV